MIRTAFAASLSVTLFAQPLLAQTADQAQIDALYEALGMPEIIDIMREEGVAYGAELGAEMLPDGGGADWQTAVNAIYDPQIMDEEVRVAFAQALVGDDVDQMLDFFTSARGEQIIALEVSARRALLDEAVEEASKEAAALQMADETPRFLAIQEFVETNDLIESNVVGALNSSYAFYLGLIDGGVMPQGITAETALQDVWAQEADIRNNTTEWVYSFLLMAYEPLSDEDLSAYLAFSETDAGQDLNDALFQAFDGMFEDISRALGLASSRFMISQEL
ncbi:DUF2059 domain-containing protein [Yoonia litorea]|uniref:Uncharacterized protein n=1 Tax=Yoonia litorea TaxID=1123755 RepID=A0A1I6M696_9RHOB|nr:DUF2059 domain-containing protein [Yoonia litorea]SFS11191.1 hypothetical protein SAMN05444714_1289 [Yoonia litorea]